MARYRFYTLDVLTDTPFGGNPLAVVLDADGLSGERMQTIAAEFNLSETVFVLKPAKPGAHRRKLRADLWEKLLSGWWAKSVYLFTTDTVSKAAQIHARMFAPAMGIAEDPATGGAASALAGFLHGQEPRDGRRRWLIEQGFEMGRPSRIELEANIAGGRINAVRVGGSSVLISEGWLNVG